MSIVEGIKEKLSGLIVDITAPLVKVSIQKAVEKGLKKAVLVAIALIATKMGLMRSLGVSVSIDPDVAVVGLVGLLEGLRTFVKARLGERFPILLKIL